MDNQNTQQKNMQPVSVDKMKEMKAYADQFRKENPKASQRTLIRAVKRKFPNVTIVPDAGK